MASETPEKSVAGNLALNGLKPKDMEVLSLMVLCATPEAHVSFPPPYQYKSILLVYTKPFMAQH